MPFFSITLSCVSQYSRARVATSLVTFQCKIGFENVTFALCCALGRPSVCRMDRGSTCGLRTNMGNLHQTGLASAHNLFLPAAPRFTSGPVAVCQGNFHMRPGKSVHDSGTLSGSQNMGIVFSKAGNWSTVLTPRTPPIPDLKDTEPQVRDELVSIFAFSQEAVRRACHSEFNAGTSLALL